MPELDAAVGFYHTCPRHRALFYAIVHGEGVSAPAIMAEVRHRFVVETSKTYPGQLYPVHSRPYGE